MRRVRAEMEQLALRNEVAPRWKAMQDPKQPMAGRGVAVKRVDYAPDLFTADALKFIREHHRQPFFLYYALNIPHAPYILHTL